MVKRIQFQSSKCSELINLTEQVRQIVQSSGIRSGVCVVYSPHTTAGLTLNSSSDPLTAEDILADLDRIVPTRVNFRHTLDTPGDAAGHVKLVLVGNSVLVPVQETDLGLGHSQSILFCEFDGPRDREVQVQLLRDSD
jgi:secondary thiamine-phosphate synthase enzyme